jgi:hypothetical protein
MSKDTFYRQLLLEEKELSDALDAVRRLKKYYDTNETKSQKSLPFDEPQHNIIATIDGYDQEWTLHQKTIYALNTVKTGTADDVALKLVDLDSSFSKDKAKKVATHHLSLAYRNNEIGATKVGKKYRYFIKEE